MSRPIVEAVFSTSLNGSIASETGEGTAQRYARGLTNSADQAFLRERIEEADLVLTSFATMKVERGAVRNQRKDQIPWVVAVSERNLDALTSLGLRSQRGIPTSSVTFVNSPCGGEREFDLRSGAHLRTTPDAFFRTLHLQGFRRVLFLGGAQLFAKMLSWNFIDELSLGIMPRIGPECAASRLHESLESQGNCISLSMKSVEVKEGSIFARYDVVADAADKKKFCLNESFTLRKNEDKI